MPSLLPAPRPVERRETSDREREDLVAAFAISPESVGLTQAGRGPAADLARWFIDFACDYGAGDPLRWSPIAVEALRQGCAGRNTLRPGQRLGVR